MRPGVIYDPTRPSRRRILQMLASVAAALGAVAGQRAVPAAACNCGIDCPCINRQYFGFYCDNYCGPPGCTRWTMWHIYDTCWEICYNEYLLEGCTACW